MDSVAEKIFLTNLVTDDAGIEYKLHSHTPKEQCQFLQQIIFNVKPKVSLEIGLAYGISTLFICEALKEVHAQKHIVIDPFQEDWKNIGIKNIKDAGYEDLVDFRPNFSHEVLPQLLLSVIKVDFAYIDTIKIFDEVLTNVYYISKLLNIGGVMILDDCHFPGIRKVCRLLSKQPSFKRISGFDQDEKSIKRQIFNKLGIDLLLSYLPYSQKIFAPKLLENDEKLGVNYRCICFQKIKEDERNWDWFAEF